MHERTNSRVVDQLAGDGWLLAGGVRLTAVTYAIDIHEVETGRDGNAGTAIELRVRLFNHAITAVQMRGQQLTLRLKDGRRIIGFLSDDGAQLVRTGELA